MQIIFLGRVLGKMGSQNRSVLLIALNVFLAILIFVSGILIGYFAIKRADCNENKEISKAGRSQSSTSKYRDMLLDAIDAKNLENNLK